MRKETITLAGKAERIKSVKELLQHIMSKIAYKGGLKYLLAKQGIPEAESVSSHAYISDEPVIQKGKNGEPSDKVFAIKPKDDEELVKFWMNSILPVLPEILFRGLGGTYTASLVRRGSSDFDAIPCIQIESPFIPRPQNRASIEEALDEIWRASGKRRNCRLLFTKGYLRKLIEGLYSDTVDDDPDQPRLHFNLNRPCSKPGMGASLGLTCSTRVSGTLGGYILIDGAKYILTSDHFVKNSRDTTINSGVVLENQDEEERLVSPSLADLANMIQSLEQTEREYRASMRSEGLERYDKPDIQPRELHLESTQRVVNGLADIRHLLAQVNKPCRDFTLGEVFRRSNAPRRALDAQALGPDHANRLRNMDWAICRVNDERAGENRHKYQSNDDAAQDHYIHENNRVGRQGKSCDETCDIDPAAQIYYVGRKSGHREGIVNGAPIQTCIEYVVSCEWSILGPPGQPIQKPSVEGDSGAWVIRKYDNKLMGQVNAYSSGQIIFTPIKDIFADIHDQCGVVVSLPSIQRTPAVATNSIPADQLCSIESEPVVKPYRWLTEPSMMPSKRLLRVHTQVSTSATLSTVSTEILGENEVDNDQGFSDRRRGSFSPPPSLTASPSSSVPSSPLTPPSSSAAKMLVEQLDNREFWTNTLKGQPVSREVWTKLSEPRVGIIVEIEDQEQQKTGEPKTVVNAGFRKPSDKIFGNTVLPSVQETKSGRRSFSWPVPSFGKFTKPWHFRYPLITRKRAYIDSILLRSRPGKPLVRTFPFDR